MTNNADTYEEDWGAILSAIVRFILIAAGLFSLSSIVLPITLGFGITTPFWYMTELEVLIGFVLSTAICLGGTRWAQQSERIRYGDWSTILVFGMYMVGVFVTVLTQVNTVLTLDNNQYLFTLVFLVLAGISFHLLNREVDLRSRELARLR